MTYHTGTPRSGEFRIAGFSDLGRGLIFFPDEKTALAWLIDPLKPWQCLPGRHIFRVQFGDVTELKVDWPAPPALVEEELEDDVS